MNNFTAQFLIKREQRNRMNAQRRGNLSKTYAQQYSTMARMLDKQIGIYGAILIQQGC